VVDNYRTDFLQFGIKTGDHLLFRESGKQQKSFKESIENSDEKPKNEVERSKEEEVEENDSKEEEPRLMKRSIKR
jgi:hypothetical protein